MSSPFSSSFAATGYLATFAGILGQISATDGAQAPLDLDAAGDRAIQALLEVRANGRKVMMIGNGGSAAIVSHLHNDLSKAVGVRALVFNEPPLLTALANDEGYCTVFERPIGLWAEGGDVLIAVSSSGRSENILRGARAARERDCTVITLSGFHPANPLRGLGHLNFYVPSEHYGMVEQAHSVFTHYLSDGAAAAAALDTFEKEKLAS